MAFAPTAEQQQALDAFASGGNLVIEAGAGTGKTSTLNLLTEANPSTKFTYLAFNRAVADDAKARFGRNVQAYTAHGYAMRALRRSTDPRVGAVLDRLNAPRTTNAKVADGLGIRKAFRAGERVLRPATLAALAKRAVVSWCYSDAAEISAEHVPAVAGIDDPDIRDTLVGEVLPWAAHIWDDATSADGVWRTDHDFYLKLFALTCGRWDTEVALVDEAQDSNPVIASMLEAQIAAGVRVVAVGDRAQTLYAWRDAVDVMTRLTADHRVELSQSFRFGPRIAAEANRWLDLVGTPLRLSGTAALDTRIVDRIATPDAVLCRTNAEAMSHLIEALSAGRKAALVGGGKEIQSMAEAAIDLKTKGETWHPDLCAFTSWGAVQEYVEEGGGQDLKTFVNLIDTYGPNAVITAVKSAADADDADVVMSTAHRAKGREWNKVTIGDDFHGPEAEEPADPNECMLAYVAVTRAKGELDRGSLAWIDKYRHPVGAAEPSPPAAPSGQVAAPAMSEPSRAAVHPPVAPQLNAIGDPITRTLRLTLPAGVWDYYVAVAAATGCDHPVDALTNALIAAAQQPPGSLRQPHRANDDRTAHATNGSHAR